MDRVELKAHLVATWLGSPPSRWRAWSWLDWKFNEWLFYKCLGNTILPAEYVFLRCMACGNLRTARMRGLSGSCKCGSRKSDNNIGTITTRRALWALIRGY